jgi:hypothetical protein
MDNTELYINKRLCDISDSISIRLNRQLINPAELNTKDAQYSYSITLPATGNNNDILGYANIEETRDKFVRIYAAELIINGIRVFVGNFRLSEVTHTQYKGNLYIPTSKSIKEIFGDKKLNENTSYNLPFTDFASSVSLYNNAAKNGVQPAIFPYVLYGLLPKVSTSNGYSERTLWDDTVRMGMSDLSPAINPIKLLQHIFQSRGYNLVGTALNDEKLTKLYMSYRGEADYVQPWNYGDNARMRVRGTWDNALAWSQYEKGFFEGTSPNNTYSCNLFNSTNVRTTVIDDPGQNVKVSEYSEDGATWRSVQIYIPISGFYKIEFNASILLYQGLTAAASNGIRYVSANINSNFTKRRYEIKVLRDRGTGDFGLMSSRIDGVFYKDNQNQNNVYDANNVPKYMPLSGGVNLIDLAQNDKFIVGLQWGRNDIDTNPLDDAKYAWIEAAKPTESWDPSNDTEPTKLALNCPGYAKYDVDDEEKADWDYLSDRYTINLRNAPTNSASRSGSYAGDGSVNAVVWLDAGELLTIVSTSDEGGVTLSIPTGWVRHALDFDLKITPFRADSGWLKISPKGNSTGAMNWNDPINFVTGGIDLIKFLPDNISTDSFIENFCKAFNLRLSRAGENTFSLDVKQKKADFSSQYVNLDNLASVRDRVNQSLGLPSYYDLGFTINQEEQGYIESGDDGGGRYVTGSTDDTTTEQKSSFSYNWFKSITKTESAGNIILPLPIISKGEVWTEEKEYSEAMLERYTDLASRFFYYDGLLNDLGADFSFGGSTIYIAKVSNELPGLSVLNYKNHSRTILDNYFTLLISGSSHYTEIEGYLTPAQYEAFNGSVMAVFNGDLYYVAEISGYDPSGRNKTKIKLIRKI